MESEGGRFTSPIPVATSSPHHNRGLDSVTSIQQTTSPAYCRGGLSMKGFVGRGEYAVCCVGGLDMHSVSGGECVRVLSFGLFEGQESRFWHREMRVCCFSGLGFGLGLLRVQRVRA